MCEEHERHGAICAQGRAGRHLGDHFTESDTDVDPPTRVATREGVLQAGNAPDATYRRP
jgi:hypothetical protein